MPGEGIPLDPYATGANNFGLSEAQQVAGGRFTLKRLIGRGGMGIVWLAYDERLQSEVALKFLPTEIKFDAVAIDDLRRETARSQRLSHPHIIRIHDLYEREGEDPFLSMEFVNGANLGTFRVKQPGRVVSWEVLEPLARQLCEALAYAHSEGTIHRDLKPANLMLDQSGKLKLADFGIARAVTDTCSRNSGAKAEGTLLYMSRQQLEGKTPKPSDDLYALGATLYELLTSKPPFYSGDLIHQIRTLEPQPMQERLAELGLSNDVPVHVEKAILACLSKTESNRPKDALMVWEQLAPRGPLTVSPGSRTDGAIPITPFSQRAREHGVRWVGVGAASTAIIASWLIMSRHPTAEAVKARPISEAQTLPASERPRSPSGQVKPPATVKAEPLSAPPVSSVEVARTGTSSASASHAAEAALPSPALPQISTTMASTQPTALKLAREGNSHVSERSRNKIVQISSPRSPIGSPRGWGILYADSQARAKLVEVRFEDGRMVRVHEPARILGFLNIQARTPLELDSLRIDSDEALALALRLAKTEELEAAGVEFELESGYGGLPVWKVRLFSNSPGTSSSSSSLGYVLIAADDGKILKETFGRKNSRTK